MTNGNIRSVDENQHNTSNAKSMKNDLINDLAYYITKELLMTERTYKKDLEVITRVRKCIHLAN